ncbi:SEL1-like repeat protein [Roseicyclus sp.]
MFILRFHGSLARITALLSLFVAAAPSSAQSVDLARNFLDRGKDELAFHQVLPLAVRGDAQAAALLADMLYAGRYVQRDIEAAMSWYAFAAERGDARAQNRLAALHDFGAQAADTSGPAD